jgi:hypothetical protein
MQVVNATVPVVSQSDLFGQINSLASTIAVLVSTLGGIVTYIVTKYRTVKKEELTERDKWILDATKATQITAQKAAEQIGQSKEVIKTIYEMNVSAEERKKIEEKIGPLLAEANIRLDAANQQAAMIKGKAVQVFGEAGDVDKDPTVPREASDISMRLRTGGKQ